VEVVEEELRRGGGTETSEAEVAYMMRACTYSCRRPNSTTKKEVGAWRRKVKNLKTPESLKTIKNLKTTQNLKTIKNLKTTKNAQVPTSFLADGNYKLAIPVRNWRKDK